MRQSLAIAAILLPVAGCVYQPATRPAAWSYPPPPPAYAPPAYAPPAYPRPDYQPDQVYDPGPEIYPDYYYNDGAPAFVVEGVPVPVIFFGGFWGYYDRGHIWHRVPDRVAFDLNRRHPGGAGIRAFSPPRAFRPGAPRPGGFQPGSAPRPGGFQPPAQPGFNHPPGSFAPGGQPPAHLQPQPGFNHPPGGAVGGAPAGQPPAGFPPRPVSPPPAAYQPPAGGFQPRPAPPPAMHQPPAGGFQPRPAPTPPPAQTRPPPSQGGTHRCPPGQFVC